MPQAPRILVISFSPIARDARVLREISVLSELGTVTSIGYGPTPANVMEHIEVGSSLASLPQTIPGVLNLAARRFGRAKLMAPATREAVRLLRGREFDLVVANDARALPLAFAVRGEAPVWADLHEWAPGERTQILSWRLLVAPFMDYLCRTYLPRCAAVSTVGPHIARLYARNYDVHPALVRNAAPLADLQPSQTPRGGALRLVHSGGAVAGRNLEGTIEAVIAAGDDYSLDLYLVPANDGGAYLRKLKAAAEGCARIRFHPPVPPTELARTLNNFDVGVFWIPPTHVNAKYTLPNKLFDYIQARLAIAVGPTIEMEQIVGDYGLGVVSTDFSVEAIVASLRDLTPDAVDRYKRASHNAAAELSFDAEAETIRGLVHAALHDG